MTEYLTKIVAYADQLFLLAPAPFTIVVVISVGYIFRGIKWFPNAWIPFSNMVVGTTLYCALNWQKIRPDMTRTEFAIRIFFTGLVISFAGWKFHESFVAQIEEKIPFLKGWIERGNTQ